ncbi:MAG: FeoB small GTPase domain-containing protein, partial [Endomicrobiales bacterium]
DKTVILVGNPNVGKSVIFNRLTGRYAVVSNYPGTTVDVSRGVGIFLGENFQVIDTPGTGSLLPSSEDEQVTRDVLFRERPDVVVQVADAKNLLRSLLLTLELMETGIPLVLALNMSDEADSRGITIDRNRLKDLLGIPVVGTVGITGEGMAELKKEIQRAGTGRVSVPYGAEIHEFVDKIERSLPGKTAYPRTLALLLASGDSSVWRYLDAPAGDEVLKDIAASVERFVIHPRLSIFRSRSNLAAGITGEVQRSSPGSRISWLERLGQLSMRPFPGYALVLFVLFLMYEFIGVFAAGTLVDLLENRFFGAFINPLLAAGVEKMVQSPLLRDFLIGPYGLFTMAVTYAL